MVIFLPQGDSSDNKPIEHDYIDQDYGLAGSTHGQLWNVFGQVRRARLIEQVEAYWSMLCAE